MIATRTITTPAGELLLGEYNGMLCLCDWTASSKHSSNIVRLTKGLHTDICLGDNDILQQAEDELREYFTARRQHFTVKTLLIGTDFQKKVWQALMTIPYGQTVSYKQIATLLGCPQAVRAVANANARNAISIIVPCHRVVGQDGSLTGYAGGLQAKSLLQAVEMRTFAAVNN